MKHSRKGIGNIKKVGNSKAGDLLLDAQRSIIAKNWEAALKNCSQLTKRTPNNALAWMLKGQILKEMGRFAEAEEPFRSAVKLAPNESNHAVLLASTLRCLNRLDEAEAILRNLLKSHPELPDAWNNLGNILINRFHYQEAENCFKEALKHTGNPEQMALWLQNLGAVLMHQAKNEEAYKYFEQAGELNPDEVNIQSNLGALLLRLGKVDEAGSVLNNAHKRWSSNSGVQSNLANVLTRQGNREEAKAIYERLANSEQADIEALMGLARIYKEESKEDNRVTALLEKALEKFPNHPKVLFGLACHQMELGNIKKSFILLTKIPEDVGIPQVKLGIPLLRLCLSLQITYPTEEAMKEHYANFALKLDALETAWSDTFLESERWCIVGSSQPFMLAYMPFNQRNLLERYGRQIVYAMEIKFGTTLPERPTRSRICVGVVSSHFRRHSVWDVITSGWFRNIDREHFELIAYDLDLRRDKVKGAMESLCEKVVSGFTTTEEWIDKIRADAPDVLIYPEIGMECGTTQLACNRLAPVQCVSWGHPVTSGLPTMDYYISAELIESELSESHYTEQLIRLPGLGVSLQPIDEIERTFDLKKLDLTDRKVRILCPQSIYKLLPIYDHIFIKLAKCITDCQFIFFEHERFQEGVNILKERLEKIFADNNLAMSDYCKFLPFLSRGEFYGLLRQCTLAFDCPGFSGFTTAMQLYHYGLPMVTLEGEFMRQRLAAGILRQIGVDELIAYSESEFIEKMVYYATHEADRHEISERLKQGMAGIYGDTRPIRALEDFLISKFQHHIKSIPLTSTAKEESKTTTQIESSAFNPKEQKIMDKAQTELPANFDPLIEPWRFLDPGQNNHIGFLNPNYAPRGLIDLLETPPKLALDIGCFIGATGAYIKQKWSGCRVVGIEPVAEAAAQARTKVDAVFEGFFEDMPEGEAGVTPGSVDLAVFADVLEHMRHPWAALRNIREWLSPNGVVLVSLPNIRNLTVLKELAIGTFCYRPAGILDITHIRFFTRYDAIKMFEQTGFKVEKMAVNPDASLGYVLQQVPKGRKIKLELGKITLNEVDFAEAQEMCALQFYFLLRAK
ncbi:MAG: tetratricopeptide repeat protein [Desulfamplus sp.]|nr:tetratricopeptide repeat protein [Desulfamplus sp.]